MPELSIITICFNDRAGLGKTIASVMSQTWRDYEYIIIDGGSTDGSAELMASHSDQLAYWVSEKDRGIYDAQNKGWRAANGKYCLFLNSGDILADQNVLRNMLSDASADIIYGDILVDNGKDTLYRLGQPHPFTFDDIIYTTLFHPAAFIRRSLLETRNGYDEQFRIVADYDFFLEELFVRKCSTEYRPFAVAVFNTAGVGSDPANRKVHDAERRKSQLKYFSATEIDAAEKRVRKRKPRSIRLKESVSGIPVIREMTNFGLMMYNRLRKIAD